MFGRTTLLFAIAIGVLAAAWWYNPLTRDITSRNPSGSSAPIDVEGYLYSPVEAPKRGNTGSSKFAFDPIVVPDCSLAVVYSANVPAQQDGQLLLIGTIISEEEAMKLPPGQFEMREMEPSTNKNIDPRSKKKPYYFRRLKEDAPVDYLQVLGLVNPVKAWDKYEAAQAKLEVAKAQHRSQKALVEVSQKEVDRMEKGITLGGAKTISPSELAIQRAQLAKAIEDQSAKMAEITASEKEVNTALTELNQHVIRNLIPGKSTIKTIDKKPGEAVKNLETVLQLQNNSLLRAEGLIDASFLGRLKSGTQVRVEPSYEEAPLWTRLGHRREITSVAVGRNSREPLIVTGSLDKSMRIWSATTGETLISGVKDHPDAVRAVATAPKGSAKNWCLSGCSDGSVRLWDLDKLDDLPVVLKDNPHRDAVTALAFSQDGKWFATGGADNLICIWSTEDASLLYPINAHHGADNPPQGQITSLTFTPQCRLIAAGRDNAIRIWELHTKGVIQLGNPIADRSGTVPLLGVSQDGQQMLFDQGKTLQVLSVPDGRTVAVPIKKPSTSTPFETFALFSPDATLILTAGAPDGRLQLWRSPTSAERAFEVRVFSSTERSNATCAAFAPKDATIAGKSFAVSGTREGQVMLWQLPTAKEILDAPVSGVLSYDNSVEASGRQARILVEIENSNNRLVAGKQVTVVINP
jgi:WD40 repeat protein